MTNEEEVTKQLSNKANFIGKNGKLYLVRCMICNSENYAPSVSSGQCAWCLWEAKQ